MSDLTGHVTHLEWSATPLVWIPLAPLVGAAINALLGTRLQRSAAGAGLRKKLHTGSFAVSAVAVTAMLVAFGLTVVNVARLAQLEPSSRYLYSHAWQMARIGSLDVNLSFAMDPLSAVMALVITGVGSLIHVYACAYMAGDPAYARFFAYLNFFVFAMLLLVLGDNFVVMFFGWEGVGLASYLLIGFWWRDYAKASAGMKAFVVNRVGDWGFIAGVALLFWALGGAWIDQGRFRPDFRARFAAVQAEAPTDDDAAAVGAASAAGGPGTKDRPDPKHRDRATPNPLEPRKAPPTPSRRLPKSPNLKGMLTMTSHPGAKVYLGVSDGLVLRMGHPPEPFAVSPFVRKEVPPNTQNITVVPGGGAVIAGDGFEVALVEHVDIEGGEETVIAPIGPTVTFREIEDQLAANEAGQGAFLQKALLEKTAWGGFSVVTLACLLLFFAATGKSAQIPLYVWLPDAMAGPTPVSALIHAATMVTAGVYLLVRLNFLFALSPVASGIVALVGGSTALFAALVGFFQYDIKKVLAYSTVSQLGFMFLGVGAGAYWAGVFHLVTHAFFKACLFLAAGSVIHGLHKIEPDETRAQDLRNMGGLAKAMPKTARAYFIACLAATAAPIPFLAGFWSKDEILWRTFTTENTGPIPSGLLYGLGLVAAVCTSFYVWRSYYLTFHGPAREGLDKVDESPSLITGVLAALAFLSAVGGVALGFSKRLIDARAPEGEAPLERWLAPVVAVSRHLLHFREPGLGLELGLMAVATLAALGAWAIARKRYGTARRATWAEDEQNLPGFLLLQNKFYVDETYQRLFVRPFLSLRLVLADMDRWIVDGVVNGVGVGARATSWLNGTLDRYLVDGLVNLVAKVVLAAGERLRKVQTGKLQNYILALLGGVVLLAVALHFLR